MVITMMTSSKSVKIGNRHNFSTKCPLILIDPSFFMSWDVFFQKKMYDDGIGDSKICWRQLSFGSAMTSYWRHVTSQCWLSDFCLDLYRLLILTKFEDDWTWTSFRKDMKISIFMIFYRFLPVSIGFQKSNSNGA